MVTAEVDAHAPHASRGERMERVRVAGVDGCPGGWVAAVVDDDGYGARQRVTLRLVTAAELPRLGERVGVDIPMGLPDGAQRRTADAAARALLPGRRGASVFGVPVRAVLAADGYAQACELSRTATGRALSLQSWFLVPKIREVDDVLAAAGCDHVGEVHPEVAFVLMARAAGRPTSLPSKKTPHGAIAREALLAEWLELDVGALVRTAPRPARVDDALDALACAWSAQRWAAGTAVVLGDPEARDARGRPQVIRA